MHNELINLLPAERARALSRDYTIRFVTVVALMVAALVLAAAALLLPSYVFLLNSENTKTNRLAAMESTPSSADEKSLSARLTALTAEAATLVKLGNSPSVSSTMRQTLMVPHPGIVLVGLSYTAAKGKSSGTLVVSGVAATRYALRGYQLALQSAPLALSANLPVSAYAKDAQIQFAITLILAP